MGPGAWQGVPVTAVGSWTVLAVDGADVRLRSGRIGLVSVDVTAPVTGGELHVTLEHVRLTLHLALDKLSTRNFLMEGAARSLVRRHDAHSLDYAGLGPGDANPWQVSGNAISGNVNVELELTITPVGPSDEPMAEIELMGTANVGTVNLPLPGLGRVDDFSFDVDAKLALRAKAH